MIICYNLHARHVLYIRRLLIRLISQVPIRFTSLRWLSHSPRNRKTFLIVLKSNHGVTYKKKVRVDAEMSA